MRVSHRIEQRAHKVSQRSWSKRHSLKFNGIAAHHNPSLPIIPELTTQKQRKLTVCQQMRIRTHLGGASVRGLAERILILRTQPCHFRRAWREHIPRAVRTSKRRCDSTFTRTQRCSAQRLHSSNSCSSYYKKSRLVVSFVEILVGAVGIELTSSSPFSEAH
jgi:hypothetical protein